MTHSNMVYGDAAKLIKDVPDNSVDLILTDPLYNIKPDEQKFYYGEFRRVVRSTGWIILFCKPENQWVIKPDQYLFWVKPISTKNTSKSYSRFVEMIFVYGYGTWVANRHWSQYTNVFTDLVDSKLHPYRKPPSLLKRLILNHTNEGDLVLDPFAGSKTTLEEAIALGRRAKGFEIVKPEKKKK